MSAERNIGDKDASILWINLREEPLIYINNRPFVLREMEHPLSNMGTYSGLSSSRLQDMETRLKEDVLKEAKEHGNILVHDELPTGGKRCSVVIKVTHSHSDSLLGSSYFWFLFLMK